MSENDLHELQEQLNNECHECGSEDLKATYYDHDGSLEGYRCQDCRNYQEKVVLLSDEECEHCGSERVRKAFDSANLWVMNKCMECGALG